MKIDRDLQFLILSRLKDYYPSPLRDPLMKIFAGICDSMGYDHFYANIIYLQEHGLLRSGLRPNVPRSRWQEGEGISITAKGIDFLENDGGLSAILNCVTVRIHDETLARIETFLEQSPLPEPQKKAFREKLRELPFDATKHLVCKLLDLALGKTPDALQLIQTLLS